jgi:hypothetical protein
VKYRALDGTWQEVEALGNSQVYVAVIWMPVK